MFGVLKDVLYGKTYIFVCLYTKSMFLDFYLISSHYKITYRLKGVIVLETETSLSESQLSPKVPSFLEVITTINKHKLQFLWQVFKYNNYYLT